MRLNNLQILRAIYKHRALSIKQLCLLFDKHFTTICQHLQRLKEKKFINMLRSTVGVFYFITSNGIKLLGKTRAYRTTKIEKEHTNYEIFTIRYLIDKKAIIFKDYDELLNSYETDREIKSRKFNEIGGKAHKLRWVDLLIKTKEGLIAYEIELTKKEKSRYKNILHKLDNQVKADKWNKVVWVVNPKIFNWIKNTFEEIGPSVPTSIINADKVKIKLSEKQKNRYSIEGKYD